MTLWEDLEPDFGAISAEVRRLYGRALKRWLLVLLVSAAIAGVLTFRASRKAHTYESTVVLSVTEGDLSDDAVAHTSANFQDYIFYGVFTDNTLKGLLEKHEFRPDLQKTNPQYAIEQFRDLIDINVYKNEFTVPRYTDSPPRSARVAISARSPDPDEALLLARDLGDLVIARDTEIRRANFDSQMRFANDTISLTKSEIDRLTREYEFAAEMESAIEGPRKAQYTVRAEGAARSMFDAYNRLDEQLVERDTLKRTIAADSASLELQYERVDWGIAQRLENKKLVLVKVALFSFLALLPLVALAIGAFDPRVYDERDIKRIGLKGLGVVKVRSREKRLGTGSRPTGGPSTVKLMPAESPAQQAAARS